MRSAKVMAVERLSQKILAQKQSRTAYRIRLAQSAEDIRAAQTLRFLVFNLELHEGLEQSFETCRDADPFDDICDHLLVETSDTNEVVGTYRLQTGAVALAKKGYYSAQEFDFKPLEPLRGQMIELGRACVHIDHRNLVVLSMLWKGIADYARARGGRYLVGCSSLSSQDSAEGSWVYNYLSKEHLVSPEIRTVPNPGWVCPLDKKSLLPVKVPKLLRAYLSLGAKICGPPALDPVFKTIDFLTMLDLDSMSPETVKRYLS